MRKISCTIQLDSEILEKIKVLAERNHISLAAQIRIIISSYLLTEGDISTCLGISIRDKTK